MSSLRDDTDLTAMLSQFMAESAHAPTLFVVDLNNGYQICHASASSNWLVAQGRYLPECIPTLTPAKLKQIWRTVCKTGTFSIETDFLTAHGHIVIEVVFSRLESNARVLMTGHIRDITEQKHIEGLLAQREQEFRSLAENSPNSIIRYDREGRICYLNSGLARVLGVSDIEAVVGKLPSEAWPDGRYDAIQQAAAQTLAMETEVRIEINAQSDSEPEVYQIRVVPERDVTGQVIGTIAFGVDITAIRSAERQLTNVVANLPGLAFTFRLSPDGHASFPFASPGIEKLYGLKPEDVKHDMAPLYALTHPEDKPRIEAAIAESARTLLPLHMEFRVCRPGFPERWIETRSMPTTEGADGSILWHGVMLDITKRKRMNDTLMFVAQRGWQADGEPFLTGLVRYLGQILGVDYVIIDKLTDDAIAETIAICAKGNVLPNMRYSLKGTPCNNIMDGNLCCYPANIQQQFPEDTLLIDMQVESYAGIPLWDSAGKVIGLIAILDGKPMQDVALVESILKLVSTRVAAEMQRDLSERKLAESQQFLQEVIDTVADPIFVKDRQHRWLLLNQAMSCLMRQAPEALLGKTDYDFFPVSEARLLLEKDELVFTQGGENINEESYTDDAGVTHTIVTSKRCFTDMHGNSILVGSIKDVTSLKQTQRHLEETANHLRSVLQTTPDYLWLKDSKGAYLACNPAAERLFGVMETDLIGKTDYDFFDAEVADGFRHNDKQTMEAGAIRLNEEWVTLAEDKRQVLLETRKVPVRDGEGKVVGVLSIGRDITDRRQDEARLALQDHALNHVNEAVYLVDEDARILHVNKAASSMLGYTQDELLAMRIYDIDPDFGPEKWRQHWSDLLTRGTITLETSHRNKVGNLVPIEVNANFIAHESRHYNFALVRDISERKQAQDAIQRSQSALAEAQRIAHIGSWEVDMVNDTLTWSDETFRIWEIDKTQFAATFAAFLETVHPEDREKVTHAYNQSITDKSSYQVEHRLLFPDNRVKYIQELGEPYFDEDGRPVRFIGTALDITERIQAEQALVAREREFRTLVENLPTYVVRLDYDLLHTYANPAFIKAVGLPAADILGTHVSAFWRAENVLIDDYIALLTRVLRSGIQEELTLAWRDEAGQLFSHLVRVNPELVENGSVQGLLVLGFDITEHSRQQALEVERQRVFEMIAHGGELNETLKQVARYVESAKSGQHCSILLRDEEGNHLIPATALSFPLPCHSSEGIELREGKSCCATAVLRSERIVVENFSHPACHQSCQTFARDNGLAACWSEPIVGASGKVLGVVVIYREKTVEADSQDLTLLRHASYLSSITIERKRLESQMLYQASYDSLTGLPNRRLFGQRLREEIAKAERARESLALFFIDLDRFKEVNDTLGHDVGDLLLTKVAQRISACVRESDTVARLGGDEFIIILTQVEDISYLGRLAQNIINQIAQPFHLGEHTAYVSASIGIAGYPLDADGAESLVGNADQAMYTAKEQGRNNFSFFTSDMQLQVQARMLLANDLRDAIVNNQLQVWYQPIVDITTGAVVKAEALLRWKHPVRGMVPPDKFIPIAEENGLIHEIGDWVFRQAVQVVQRWNAGNLFQRQISINLSPRQFLKGNIDNMWLEHLEQLNFDPAQITIEITEGLLLNDRPEIMRILSNFGSAGMQVALDDFGTGYSAMAYLKKFPIDYLKIDRSFVRDLETDPGDRAIAEAIIVMARKLGIKVIAEGVETIGQSDLLAAVGCEYVQGYLYGKPMPEDEFMSFVA